MATRSSGCGAWRMLGIVSSSLILAIAYGSLLFFGDNERVQTLSLIFGGIVLEAMPFMLIGALAGGLIEVFFSREKMASILPTRGWLTVMLSACMGLIFPVCECAVVPIVKRLARKGLPPAACVAYLLSGPVFGPIVALSTALAYNFDMKVVALRMMLGYGIAVLVALAIGWIFSNEKIFLDSVFQEVRPESGGGCGNNHSDEECGSHSLSFSRRIMHAFSHGADDFVTVGHFLVIGAFIAAAAQTFVPRAAFTGVSNVPVLPSVLMMVLAMLLNLCSEADAFIAASFSGLIPLPGQMAFMLTGPMFDLKLLLMYQTMFKKTVIVCLGILILSSIFFAAVGMELAGALQ